MASDKWTLCKRVLQLPFPEGDDEDDEAVCDNGPRPLCRRARASFLRHFPFLLNHLVIIEPPARHHKLERLVPAAGGLLSVLKRGPFARRDHYFFGSDLRPLAQTSALGLCDTRHRRSKRWCVTVREMKEGPSGSAIRC
jgi:hypothetical protein